jgi:hypothetical protein
LGNNRFAHGINEVCAGNNGYTAKKVSVAQTCKR